MPCIGHHATGWSKPADGLHLTVQTYTRLPRSVSFFFNHGQRDRSRPVFAQSRPVWTPSPGRAAGGGQQLPLGRLQPVDSHVRLGPRCWHRHEGPQPVRPLRRASPRRGTGWRGWVGSVEPSKLIQFLCASHQRGWQLLQQCAGYSPRCAPLPRTAMLRDLSLPHSFVRSLVHSLTH